MRDAGALVLDRAENLLRQYWVPSGGLEGEGAFVHQNYREVMAVLSLESHLNKCMVIGRRASPLVEGALTAMRRHGMLVVTNLFEPREKGDRFPEPSQYARMSVISAASPECRTIESFWEGRDLVSRKTHGEMNSDEFAAATNARVIDRELLLESLVRSGELPSRPENCAHLPFLPPDFYSAVLRFLARTPCRLHLVSLDDLMAMINPADLPIEGRNREAWSYRLGVALEELPDFKEFGELSCAIQGRRHSEGEK
jgi:4-alpha-glucanotransferase